MISKEELKNILDLHAKWLQNEAGGKRADLQYANLHGANLQGANLYHADLHDANLQGADLYHANLYRADLHGANLRGAVLQYANLRGANLQGANLRGAVLQYANLYGAVLQYANLTGADLTGANLTGANLTGANLQYADLQDIKGLVKIMGVEPGNIYWKRFDVGLKNNNYQFYTGINTLLQEEIFASDERILCSYPGFHFGSRSWCNVNYSNRPLEAKIRIPLGAKINEPWATDGKASADKIEILQIFDTKTGIEVTEKYRRK